MKHFSEYIRRPSGAGLFLLVSGVILLLFFSLNALVILISVVILYKLMDRFLSLGPLNSLVSRLFISIFMYVGLLQISVMIGWLFSRNFSLGHVPFIALLVLIITAAIEAKYKKSTPEKYPLLTRYDLIGLGVALTMTILVIVGPLKTFVQSSSSSMESLMPAYMNTSIDDSNHFSRINDRISYDRGVIYKSDATSKVALNDTISSYPPAWHAANATIMLAFAPNITVGNQSMTSYVLSKFFWFFMLVYFLLFAIVAIFKSLKIKLSSANIVWLVGSGLFFAFYALVEQFKEGFYSFIPVLIVLLILAPLLIQLASDLSEDEKRPLRLLTPSVLLISSAALSWFLIFPMITLVFLIIIFRAGDDKKFSYIARFNYFWRELLSSLPVVITAIFAIAVQIVLLLAPGSRSFTAGINDPGAISFHSMAYYAFLIIGAVLLLIKKPLWRGIFNNYLMLLSLLVFSLFVYLFQVITILRPEYYYFKTLNTAVIFCLPFAIAGWGLLVTELFEKNRSTGLLAALLFISLLPLVIGINPTNTSNTEYLLGRRSLTETENVAISRDLTEQASGTTIKHDSIFFSTMDHGHNIIATNMSRTAQHIDGCDNNAFSAILQNNLDALLMTLGTCDTTDAQILNVRPDDLTFVQERATTLGVSNKITIVAQP